MAVQASPQPGDRPVFTEYATVMQKERALLDEKEWTEGQLKSLNQTLSFLALTCPSPLTNPAVITVATAVTEKKKKKEDIVSDAMTKKKIF